MLTWIHIDRLLVSLRLWSPRDEINTSALLLRVELNKHNYTRDPSPRQVPDLDAEVPYRYARGITDLREMLVNRSALEDQALVPVFPHVSTI